MPVWAGIELIVDPYSNAKKGERLLTAIEFIGAVMVDANPVQALRLQNRLRGSDHAGLGT